MVGWKNALIWLDLYLTLTWSWIDLDLNLGQCKIECHHWILRTQWPIKHATHDTYATISYGGLTETLYDLHLPWHMLSMNLIVISYIFHPLRSILTFLFAVVTCPVSVPDNTKRDDFDTGTTWPWRGLRSLKKILESSLQCTSWDWLTNRASHHSQKFRS